MSKQLFQTVLKNSHKGRSQIRRSQIRPFFKRSFQKINFYNKSFLTVTAVVAPNMYIGADGFFVPSAKIEGHVTREKSVFNIFREKFYSVDEIKIILSPSIGKEVFELEPGKFKIVSYESEHPQIRTGEDVYKVLSGANTSIARDADKLDAVKLDAVKLDAVKLDVANLGKISSNANTRYMLEFEILDLPTVLSEMDITGWVNFRSRLKCTFKR